MGWWVMSIRPVDLQVLIPRTTDVGKYQQTADHQLINQQQQFAEQLQQAARDRQHQVQSTPKDEGGKVRRDDDQKEKNGHDGRNHQNPQEAQTKQSLQEGHDAAQSEDPVRGHLIDIKT